MQTLMPIDGNSWQTLEPHYAALLEEDLRSGSVAGWLARWSDLEREVWEARAWHKRATARDAADETARAAYRRFDDEVFSRFHAVNRRLAEKLLAVEGWQPALDQEQLVRRLRIDAGLRDAASAPLESAIAERVSRYFALVSSLVVELEGEELTMPQAEQRLQGHDRQGREMVWRAMRGAWARQHEEIGAIFLELVGLRRRLARQAGYADYRAYRWHELMRLDYAPDDCLHLHRAIEEHIVPLSAELLGQRRARLGVPTLRPWDLAAVPGGLQPLRPFDDVTQLEEGVQRILDRLNPQVGAMFRRMRDGFLDLGSRKGKMPGAEEWFFLKTGVPYIRANAVGTADDVLTVLHESGHAFHDWSSSARQPLVWNLGAPDEFAEFAAMGMVALALPYLAADAGGFYAPKDAERARSAYLETICVNWLPSIAVLDALQHWLYVEAPEELSIAQLEGKWIELSQHFYPDIDWSELEAERGSGWQSSGLLFSQPFYSIEYVAAHLGAVHLLQHSLHDHAGTLATYEQALALGKTRSLPELFKAAGVGWPFGEAMARAVAEFLREALRGE